jgi:uncharacterized protein YxjI
MNELLGKNLFFVKEHIGMFKAANNYDIYDPTNGQLMLECREDDLGLITKFFRFTGYKRNTPFNIKVKTTTGQQVLRVCRGVTFFRSKVQVFDENDVKVGEFRQRLFSLGGKFIVYDNAGNPICKIQGKWHSWTFKFMSFDKREFAMVSKKWAGLGKELFTSADNYMLEIKDNVGPDDPLRVLILAAVMCVDMVLKE